MAATNEQLQDYAKVVAKAWSDGAFKAKLLSDPHSALGEAGVEVPEGITVKAIENTRDTFHLVLPPAPKEGELADEDLDKVAGGATWSGNCLPERGSGR